jgi:hypothetical protein
MEGLEAKAGRRFTAFIGAGPTKVREVTVWLDPAAGKIGTVQWIFLEKRPKTTHSILVHRIFAVFEGKQPAELQSSAAASYDAKAAFSIFSKDRSFTGC